MLGVLLAIYVLFTFFTIIYYSLHINNNNFKIRSITILSGDFDWDTLNRIRKGVYSKEIHSAAKLIFCGKYKAGLMSYFIKEIDLKEVIIQNKSTNTYEDAVFLKEFIDTEKIFPMLLVSSQPHGRRALHTFERVFPNKKIYLSTPNEIFTIYSAFLPTGWIASAINIAKDWKYNKRFL